MKTWKRLWKHILLLCIMAAAVFSVKSNTVVAEAYTDFTFNDVKNESTFYYYPVYWAVDKGITSGTTATTFSPDSTVTRGQMVVFLYRIAGMPNVEINTKFTDMGSNTTFRRAISWAAANGITSGTTDTTFSPDASCTRGQIMTFLYRWNGSPAVSVTGEFVDVDETSPFINAVYWGAANGITNGTYANHFEPGRACTRGQAVTFLYKFFDGASYTEKKNELLESRETLVDGMQYAGMEYLELQSGYSMNDLIDNYISGSSRLQSWVEIDEFGYSLYRAIQVDQLKNGSQMVRKTNQLRAAEDVLPITSGNKELKISYLLTQYAIIANAFNSVGNVHGFFAETYGGGIANGENWASTDNVNWAYQMWYTNEKNAYVNHTGDITGHYENIVDSAWVITGVGCDGYATQEFSMSSDPGAVTPDEFDKGLDSYLELYQTYIKEVENDLDKLAAEPVL